MKIDPSQELSETQYSGKASSNEKPNANEFSAMLKEAIDDDPFKNIEGSKKPQMINRAAQVQFNTLFNVSRWSIKYCLILSTYIQYSSPNPLTPYFVKIV